MSTVYDGKPSNVAFDGPLTITNVVNGGTFCTITVSGSLPANFYQSGGLGGLVAQPWVDVTGINGVGSNMNAVNGVWPATPTGTNTFTVPCGTATGVYTSGGLVQPLYSKPVFACPSDGDACAAASIPVEQVLGDRTAWLHAQTGVAKIAGHAVMTFSSLSSSAWASASVTAAVNTWYPMAAAAGALSIYGTSILGCLNFGAGTVPINLQGLATGDALHVSLRCDTLNSGGGPVRFGLFYCNVATGTSPGAVSFGTYSQVVGCSRWTYPQTGGGLAPLELDGWIPAVSQGSVLILPAVYSLSVTGSVSWALGGDTTFVIDDWRPTGQPQ